MERDGTSGDGEAREHPGRPVLCRVVSAREGLHRLRLRARAPVRVELQHQRRALHAQRGAELQLRRLSVSVASEEDGQSGFSVTLTGRCLCFVQVSEAKFKLSINNPNLRIHVYTNIIFLPTNLKECRNFTNGPKSRLVCRSAEKVKAILLRKSYVKVSMIQAVTFIHVLFPDVHIMYL